MCYTHNSFSVILITFYTLLIIISFVVKVVKDFEKVIFVNRFDFDLIKKIVYFFAIFLYIEIRISVDFFLNKKFMNFLIIFLNIILKISEWFSLFAFSAFSRVWFLIIFSKRWSNWFDERINSFVSRMLIIIDILICVLNEILMLISLIFLLMRSLFDETWKLLFLIFFFFFTFSYSFFEKFIWTFERLIWKLRKSALWLMFIFSHLNVKSMSMRKEMIFFFLIFRINSYSFFKCLIRTFYSFRWLLLRFRRSSYLKFRWSSYVFLIVSVLSYMFSRW